jgi:hypothetical protein
MGVRRALLASALVLAACQHGLGDPQPLAELDEPYFRCKVQPVLTRSCAAFACHGDARRFFRVFARNRLRAQGTEKDRNAALSDVERASNFEAARAFVDPGSPDDSLLVAKPLDIAAGGRFHRGREIFGGGNVFLDKSDADYQLVLGWIRGAKEDPTCVEPGSNQ